MSNARIFIVEDEPIIARTIKVALEAAGYEICGISGNGKEALYDISETHPDLVILDITLSGDIDGVKVGEKLKQDTDIPFVYLTSLSDADTINRVKQTHPAGYIDKPFTVPGLRSIIEIALYNKSEQSSQEDQNKMGDAIFVKSKEGLVKISKDQILFFEAYDFYCFAHTQSGKTLVTKTLKHVEQNLLDARFLRTHRSYIVNLSKVDAVLDGYVNIYGQNIPVSKSNRKRLLDSLSLL